jgi:hypothetical protein
MQKMRAGQIHAAFEMAAFQLNFAGNFDVSQIEPVGDDRVPKPEPAVMDVVQVFGEQPFEKGRADNAARGGRRIGSEIDETAVGYIIDDQFFCDAFRLEVGWLGKRRNGKGYDCDYEYSVLCGPAHLLRDEC